MFCLKVWLTGVVGGAIGLGLTECFGSFNGLDGFLFDAIFGGIMGAICFVPSYLLLWLISAVLTNHTRLQDEWVKLTLTAVGVLLAAAPVLWVVGDHDFRVSSKIIALIYAGVIVAGIWVYRLRPRQQSFFGEGDYKARLCEIFKKHQSQNSTYMKTSHYWVGHFKASARQQRINWDLQPDLTAHEATAILPSLRAWQLAETSEGRQLIAATKKYVQKVDDPGYLEAIELFIKEEQKHGENLGKYVDRMGHVRKRKDFGDTLFRKTRHLNTSMEIWTLTVVVVESTAQIFYQSLKDATNCKLLKQICTDILIDEAYHITFQTERLAIICGNKNNFSRAWRKTAYKYFFYAVACAVWLGHRKLFKAGGNTFSGYLRKMRLKYVKTLDTITGSAMAQFA